MLAFADLARLPLAWDAGNLDQSKADPFAKLLANPDAALIYLFEAHPFAPDIVLSDLALPAPLAWQSLASPTFEYQGGEIAFYASDHGYITEPSDTLPNQPFPPVLDNAYSFEASLFDGVDPFTDDMPEAGFGDIKILNGSDGDFDLMAGLSFAGREVEIKTGGRDFAYADFTTIFRGTASAARWNEDSLSIPLRSRSVVLDNPLTRGFYGGTGGMDGLPDLAGRPKPLTYGRVRQVTPVNIDWAMQIWQIHDGPVQGIDAARDRGLDLAFAADYPTYAALLAAPLSAGSFATCNALGIMRLGAQPDGTVTIDVSGDNAGGYVSMASTIVQRILRTRLGADLSFDSQDFDLASFAAADLIRPWMSVGVHFANEITAQEAIVQVSRAVGGWLTMTRDGQLAMGLHATNPDPVRVLDETMIDDEGIEAVECLPPAWRVRVGYRRMWSVLADKDMADAVSAANRAAFRQEYRYATATDAQIRGAHRDARDVDYVALIDDASQAQSLANALLAAMRQPAYRYRVPIRDLPFRYALGDCVSLRLPRFGFDAGKPLIVVGFQESAREGENVLELWG